jgi:hypothetical protein
LSFSEIRVSPSGFWWSLAILARGLLAAIPMVAVSQ